MVEQRLGMGYAVEVAQSHFGDPTMPAAARLVEERRVSAIIFVPYPWSDSAKKRHGRWEGDSGGSIPN
jgi:hypothetical protein